MIKIGDTGLLEGLPPGIAEQHFCKLSGQYRHLQVLYSLQEDGRIIRKISPKLYGPSSH